MNQLACQLVAFKTMLWGEFKRMRRIWMQTLFPPIITSMLYFIIFGRIIGSRVGDMAGHPYIQYIAPGLIMMNVITSAYSCTASGFFSAKLQRSIEEILVAPMTNTTVMFGFMVSGILRGVVVGALVTIVALFFTHLHAYSLLGIFFSVLLTASIFSVAGIINGVFARSFDEISIIPTFVLAPLTYLGGVFYSISLLPETWQYVSLINPIVYMIDSFRFGFLGISDGHLVLSFVIMISFLVILYFIGFSLIKKGVGLRT